MAKTTLQVGDRFSFSGGFGVKVSNVEAVLIKGIGGWKRWETAREMVPADAQFLHDHKTVFSEVQLAMDAVKATIN